MDRGPRPLQAGTALAGRFEIQALLGRGGFGIAYLVRDTLRGDLAAIKELAPVGTVRDRSGLLDLEGGGVSGHRLRQTFLDEARLMSRLAVPGILPVRAVFAENGTAYYATDYLAESQTLEQVLQQEGRLNAQGAMDILFQLLETLEAIHAKGILHRDIKPSNILLSAKGEAVLIDFGAAREWHADALTHHTVLYTPGYAPIEQLSEKGRRGPATDIYALAATTYRMLTGTIPTPATDRANGMELTPLRSLRPDVEAPVARALERALSLRYHERPPTVAEFRESLSEAEEEHDLGSLAELDSTLLRLQKFGYERRQCPACRGLLDHPTPLRRWVCPVCRDGVIRKREIESRLCPNCRAGTLHKKANDKPLGFCPSCRFGVLATHRHGLLKPTVTLDCIECRLSLRLEEDLLVVANPGTRKDAPPVGSAETAAAWREGADRLTEVWMCDGCEAQYDRLEDGRWGQVTPKPARFAALYPEEWARVAAKLPPGSGNAACDVCRADYFLEGSRLTLLTTEIDTHGFAAEHLGRLLDIEDIRWLGVGKDSPQDGFVCGECGTELDKDGEYLRLVRTMNKALLRHVGEPKKLEDWHRLAQGLPEVHDEAEFRGELPRAVLASYERCEVGFDPKNEIIWRGPAVRESLGGTLTITRHEIVHGGLLKKWRVPYDALISAAGEGETLWLKLSGEPEPIGFEITPVELTAHLQSGDQSVLLTAENLAARLENS